MQRRSSCAKSVMIRRARACPVARGRPRPSLPTDYDSFFSSCCVVWLTSYSSRVDSAMRGSSISFLTRARSAWLDSCLGWCLCILARCHESKRITGQLRTELIILELLFLPSSFEAVRRNLRQVASHSARRRASCRRSDAWTIEDEQCQKIGRGYEAVKFRFLQFL
jgi:hypothetical protein